MDLISFDTLAGVPIHYSRDYPGYGTKGRQLTFQADKPFHEKLEACLTDLWTYPCKKADIIVTGGVYADQEGYHGLGRAIDIDCIFWSNKSLVTKRDGFEKENIFLYLGVEAVLRKYFGTVLNYDYVEHDDHFHVDNGFSSDDGSPLGFDPSWKNGITVAFIQAVLTYLFNKPVGKQRMPGQREEQEFNRQFDDNTKDALNLVLNQLKINGNYNGLSSIDTWHNFLDLIAKKAFELSDEHISKSSNGSILKSPNPKKLLAEVYAKADTLNKNDKSLILKALNDFRNHPETDSFLQSYNLY